MVLAAGQLSIYGSALGESFSYTAELIIALNAVLDPR